MELTSLLYFLIIGAAAGWLASQIMKSRTYGLLGNIIVGVLGAILGGWLFDFLGVSVGGDLLGSLLTALVGAIVLLWLLRMIRN